MPLARAALSRGSKRRRLAKAPRQMRWIGTLPSHGRECCYRAPFRGARQWSWLEGDDDHPLPVRLELDGVDVVNFVEELIPVCRVILRRTGADVFVLKLEVMEKIQKG